MTDIVSVKFKNRGKCYSFAPNGFDVKTGDKVIVETAKGLEIADCVRGCHPVEDSAVVQPLRPVARIATSEDLRVAQINKRREKDAFEVCQKKIAQHGLDMKLVDVECNFEGSKITFFFTSDGRVDFRELVKDLAGVFRSRIELRQIGVRDEAKMIGGIGICGRPYCCSQFLDDFQPVSTKMAKVQSLSLNPAKISGSCGRLMCCLRYEQAAYEDLVKKVPKQGAFVETKDGYGTAMQVNLLRQTVKVKLDGDSDDTLKTFKANELAAVPGGRPKDGETPPSVLHYVPPEPEEEEEKEDEWAIPMMLVSDAVPETPKETTAEAVVRKRRNNRRGGQKGKGKAESAAVPVQPKERKAQPQAQEKSGRGQKGKGAQKAKGENKPRGEARPRQEAKPPKSPSPAHRENTSPKADNAGQKSRRRSYYRGRPRSRSGGENKQA